LKEEELIVFFLVAQLAMIQHDVILLLISLLLSNGVAAFYLPPSSQLRLSFASCSTALLYQRDVYSMEAWAIENGYQKLDGVELYNTNVETDDWSLMTYSDIPAGTTVLFIPANIVLSSDEVAKEYSGNFDLELTENALKQMEKDLAKRLPLFRLLVKVLAEYEKGTDSFYYPWLASLPSQYYNGVSMTDACFACLPPYASLLAMNERNAYSRFAATIRKGFLNLNRDVIDDDSVMKFAYNVAYTRFHEVFEPNRQKLIAPMADMLNHSAEPNVEISFDADNNCYVTTITDVYANSELTVSYGDPTNPTPLFAKYGFLPTDCSTIFCKAIHLEQQIQDLGYEYNELLFNTETGEIFPKVWDIFLLAVLQEYDQGLASQFIMACQNGDEVTKADFHSNYFAYTLASLNEHVLSILDDVNQLSTNALSYDLEIHPRVPIIVAHNNLVRDTFSITASLLESVVKK
jgi:hypothetical protein